MKTANLKSHTTSEMSWNIYFQAFTVRTWRKRLSNLNTFLLPIYTGEYIPYLRNQQPAHGGKDPGKVGINGAQEKELNLQIAEKLKKYLEEHQITVVMTRIKDERLADSQVEDLKARVELIDKESPALAVCIHQNSYPQESVRGPQIFYFAHSKEAKKAAEVMQTELKNFDQEHAREIKGNTTYYMLKNTKSPIVIVECGFLSSPVEAGMLIDEAYQQKLAQAIGNGILKYVER